MSPTIWLIVEDETDGHMVQALLDGALGQNKIRVAWLNPTGNTGGVSRLAHQLERLIQDAQRKRNPGDCIAVLHDADELIGHTPEERKPYRRIKVICDKYKNDVALIIARDEIESWLLADEGLCKRLKLTPRNWDTKPKPTEALRKAVRDEMGIEYSRKREKVLIHVDGTGHKRSPSMRRAMKHLENAPCTSEERASTPQLPR